MDALYPDDRIFQYHTGQVGGDDFSRNGRVQLDPDIFLDLIATIGNDDLVNRVILAFGGILEENGCRRIKLPDMIQPGDQGRHQDDNGTDGNFFNNIDKHLLTNRKGGITFFPFRNRHTAIYPDNPANGMSGRQASHMYRFT